MPTVTGYTKDKMDEINDTTIVDGSVVGGDLILVTRAGDPVNAGSVIGPTGPSGPSGIEVCTSSTRPSSPYDGQHIYESNTLKDLIWISSKGGWFPPWNTAWGIIDEHRLTTNSSNYTTSGNTDMLMDVVPVRSDRYYKISLNSGVLINNTGTWGLSFTVNGLGYAPAWMGSSASSSSASVSAPVKFASTMTILVRVYVGEVFVDPSSTLSLRATASSPRVLTIEDIGPIVS